MNWKSFIWGFLFGVFLTFIVLFCIGLGMQNSEESVPFQYLEHPVSYEGKTVVVLKVFQALDGAALAEEVSPDVSYMIDGKMVLILGESFYDDQIIRIQNPLRIGTYSYTTRGGLTKTVPVLSGQIRE